MESVKNYWYLFTLFLLGAYLRFVNIGYSDFQGDEIKALTILKSSEHTLFNFLIDQRKGPIQFIVTYLFKDLSNNFDNYFILRLPFAIAGILGMVFFYLAIKNIFNQKVALYSLIFFITNGVFIGLNRIVQYQPFVFLFTMLALYFFSFAKDLHTTSDKKIKVFFVYAYICWALSILAHYDGLFIFFMAAALVANWYTNNFKYLFNLSKTFYILFCAFVVFVTLAWFYIPFFTAVDAATQNYWFARIEGDNSKIASSSYLFQTYNPTGIIYIYFALFVLGLGYILQNFVVSLKKPLNLLNILKHNYLYAGLLMWWVFPVIFMEYLVSMPGTHIYTYLYPTMVIMALGVTLIEQVALRVLSVRLVKVVICFGLTLFLMLTFIQAHYIFVDNKNGEYPWEDEKFLGITLKASNPKYHLNNFGFPYNRGWQEARNFVHSYMFNNGGYSTNEGKTLAGYYIKLRKDSKTAGFYVHVNYPQTYDTTEVSDKASHWMKKLEPVKTIKRGDKDAILIYYMPGGSLADFKNTKFYSVYSLQNLSTVYANK